MSHPRYKNYLFQTRNPHAVQPHLMKCFDAIARLQFGEVDGALTHDILAMVSPEVEKVGLGKVSYPCDPDLDN